MSAEEDDKRAIHAMRVMHGCGFTAANIAAVKRYPMAGSIDDAVSRAGVSDAPAPHWSDSADPDGPEWRALRESRAKNRLMNGGTGYE